MKTRSNASALESPAQGSAKARGSDAWLRNRAAVGVFPSLLNGRLRVAFSILPLLLGGYQHAMAQGGVPVTECACPLPTASTPPCCEALLANAKCTRIDGPVVVVNPGIRIHLDGPPNECSNCCKFIPDDCPGNDLVPKFRECVPSIAFTFVSTVEEIISTRIGAVSIVEGALESAAGLGSSSQLSCSVGCPVTVPKCKKLTTTPWLDYSKDRMFSITSNWTLAGFWTTSRTTPPSPCTCTLTRWNKPCGQDISTITASVCVATGCSAIKELPCEDVPECP